MSEREGSSDGGSQKETARSSDEGSVGYLPSLLPYDVRRPPFELIMRLQQERSSILAEVSRESQERDWYRQQLSATQKKIQEELDHQKPSSSGTSLFREEGSELSAASSVLDQLQSEAQRVTEGLRSRFGSEEEIERRYQERLRRIHHLELTMLRLQQASSDDLTEAPSHRAHNAKSDGVSDNAEDAKENGEDTTVRNSAVDGDSAMKERAFVTTATQTSPADLALELPEILLREELGPLEPELERNVSSAGQTCKLEVVYSLLSMLGTHDTEDLSRTLLAMTSSQDSCHAMRQSGCLPLLIQLLHGCSESPLASGSSRGRGSRAARRRATKALRNLVASNPEEHAGRREMRVLRLLEQLRAYCDSGSDDAEGEDSPRSSGDSPALGGKEEETAPATIDNPGPAVSALMKLSFDPEHHSAICALGGLQAIADLLRTEHERTPASGDLSSSLSTRRYACMALTNLTFGDGANKALLCSLRPQLEALVAQLDLPSEELSQVAASVLRNLSWRADLNSKRALREVRGPCRLIRAAMRVRREATLRAVLSALWNLSAHCTENKADICAVEGALPFLVSTLSFKSPAKTLAVIENGGGILRNISSVIALREDYRECLRVTNCLPLLLRHLRSPSLTVVSNACGTLWNLSSSCPRDQQALWELGAVPMLRALMHSKHKMISMGCASALKNLLNARPHLPLSGPMPGDVTAIPSLQRKPKGGSEGGPRATEVATSSSASTASAPGHCGAMLSPNPAPSLLPSATGNAGVPRSRSNDSVHSDQTYDRLRHTGHLGMSLLPSGPTNTQGPGLSLSGRFVTCPHGDWLRSFGSPHEAQAAVTEEQEVRTFCTEGTPYGVSTAASVQDLCAEREEGAGKPEEPPAARAAAPIPTVTEHALVRGPTSSRRLSRHRASVASGDGNESDANSEKPQDFGSRFGEGTAPTPTTAGSGLPAVSPRTYAVEDTPLTGGASRCSSLSSISELEELGSTGRLQSGCRKSSVPPACPPAVPPAAPEPHLERIEERASSEAREAASPPCVAGSGQSAVGCIAAPSSDVRKKTVTFEMAALANMGPGLAEETPLMFSRSSSLSSLGSSLGGRSLHSSVVSDYSRSRNSEVVSPSELPDSPSAARKVVPGQEDEEEEEEDEEEEEEKEEGEGAEEVIKEEEEKAKEKEKEKEDDHASSASSCGDDVTDRLLSLVIQSALPPKPGSQSGGSKKTPPREPLRGDCLTLYAMEDTPLGFSTMASSLSDLTVDSVSRQSATTRPEAATANPPPARPPPSLPSSTARSSLRSALRTGDGSASASSYGPVIYATEGTPALYSHNSPLSPLSTGANASPAPLRAAALASVCGATAVKGSASSLSSLSLDSVGLDRSLLEECISSALPKVPRALGSAHARLSRKESAQQQQQQQQQQQPQPQPQLQHIREPAVKTRQHPSMMEPAIATSQCAPHQRSRSAGAAASRSEIKASRLPLPAPPPPAAPFWGSAPLSPSVQVKSVRKKSSRSRSSAQAVVARAEATEVEGASKGRKKEKEGSLNFLFAGSDASRSGRSIGSDEQFARPGPLTRAGACVGTDRTSPERRAERKDEETGEDFSLTVWDDFGVDVTEASMEIDASSWPKPPLSDPLGPSGASLWGQGLDDHSLASLSLASSLASSPVALPAPRARIVKPTDGEAACGQAVGAAQAAPAGVRGVRGGGAGGRARWRPTGPPVRLTRAAAVRMGQRETDSKKPVRELNNNDAQEDLTAQVRCRQKESLSSCGHRVDRTTRLIEPSELLMASAAQNELRIASPTPTDHDWTSTKSNSRALTSAKPINETVTSSKPNNRTMTSPAPNNRAVTSPAPNNRTVTSPRPNNRAVTSPKPNNRAVTSPAPNNRAVTSPKPNNRAVTSPQPNNRALTSPKPNNRAVTSPKPNSRTVASPQPNNRAVTSPAPNNRAVMSPKPNNRRTMSPKPNGGRVATPKVNERPVTLPKPSNRPVSSPKPNNKPSTLPKLSNRSGLSSKSTSGTTTPPLTHNRSLTSPRPYNRSAASPKPSNRSVSSPNLNRRPVASSKSSVESVTSPKPVRRIAPNRSVTSPTPNRPPKTKRHQPIVASALPVSENMTSPSREIAPKLSRVSPVTSGLSQPMRGQNQSTSHPSQPMNSRDSGIGSVDSTVWISREEVAPGSIRVTKPSHRVAPILRSPAPNVEQEEERKIPEARMTQGVLPSL